MGFKTKRFIVLMNMFILLFTMTAFAQHREMIKASGNYKTKEIEIKNFDQIKLLGSPTIIYTQSDNGKSELKLVGSDNLLDLLECEVSNNTLIVKFKSGVNIQFGRNGQLKVMASSPSLKNILLQGSGDVILNNSLKCTDLIMNLRGSGDIKAGTVVCTNSFSATLQGSGDIVVGDRLQSVKTALILQGSGDLDVHNLVATSATVSLQGSGDLKVKGASVSGVVDVLLQGSGDLNVERIQANEVKAGLQGSGDMKLEGTTRQATLGLTSSGEIDAKNLSATNVNAKLNGSGNITCFVSGILNCSMSGSGEIGYKGNPSKIESTGKNKPKRL